MRNFAIFLEIIYLAVSFGKCFQNCQISQIVALNDEILEMTSNFNQNNGINNSKILSSFVFSGNTVRLKQKNNEKLDFQPFFEKTVNLFGDPIPQNHYFNMADIIRQYSDLNPKNSQKILDSWENALISLKNHIEKSPNFVNITKESISNILNVQSEFLEKLVFKPLGDKFEINAKVEICQKTQKDLKNLLLIIRNNYIPLFEINLYPTRAKMYDFSSEYTFSEQKKWSFIGYKVKLMKSMKLDELSILGTVKGKIILRVFDENDEKILFQEIKNNINTIYQDVELKFENINVILPQNNEILLMIDYEGLASFHATKTSRKPKLPLNNQIEVTPIIGRKKKNQNFGYSNSKKAFKIKFKLYY